MTPWDLIVWAACAAPAIAIVGAAINAATQVIITALQPVATFLSDWATKERERKEIQP